MSERLVRAQGRIEPDTVPPFNCMDIGFNAEHNRNPSN